MGSRPIYLDYNATTPLDPAARAAMEPYLRADFGNPSSSHVYGRTARAAVDRARAQVAALIGSEADEIVFTSGGSEAINHALKGSVFTALGKSPPGEVHVVISAVEHPATFAPCAFLERLGCRVTVLPVDRHGIVEVDALRQALRRPTLLVSVMHANNEVGSIQPLGEIVELAHQAGALVHTDAAQSAGKIELDVTRLGVDLLSLAGHKVYAPKGIGALYVRRGLSLEPLIHGAGHESGRRAGTENVPSVVALGAASEVARRSLPAATGTLRAFRDRLWHRLRDMLGDRVVLNGHVEHRLPNTLNVNFVGWVGADLLAQVPDVAAATGSACHEGRVALSPVLRAMGVPLELGRGAVRLSLGRFTTEAEVDEAAQRLASRASTIVTP